MTDTAGTAIAVPAALSAAGSCGMAAALRHRQALLSGERLARSPGGITVRSAGAAAAGRPHNLHTGCAAPAPHPALLGTSTGPVATEDEHHSAAVGAAGATAHPGRNAVT